MPENVVINFEASLEGFEPLIKALKDVGQLTEQQANDFLNLEKKQQEELGKVTNQLKSQNTELGKLVNNIKNVGEGAAGGAIKQATTNFSKLDTQANKLADSLVELLASGKGNTAEFKKLVKELYDTEASIRGVDSGSKKLTTQLREMKDQLAQLDEGSAEFEKLAVAAAKLEDKIGDTNRRIRTLASDTFRLDAFIGTLQGITAGFAVAQGAAALFGEENEDVQKAILKVTAAISILNGLQQLQNTLQKESAARIGITTAAKKLYTFVTNGATVATRALNAALVATVAGAILAGLAAIVVYWEDIAKFIGIAKDEQKEFLNDFDEFLAKNGAAVDRIRSNASLAQLSTRALNEELSRLKDQLEDIPRDGLEITLPNGETIKQDMSAARATLTAEIDKIQGELDRRKLKTQIEVIPVDRDGIEIIAIEDILPKDKPEVEIPVRFIAPEEVLEEEVQQLEEINQKLKEQKELREEINQAALESAQVIADQIFEIGAQRREQEYQEEVFLLERQREAELANKNLSESQKAAIEDKFKKREARLKREEFKKDKQARIIQATINTALAIVQSLANTVLPFPASLAGPVAIAIAGAAQIAAIASQPIPQFKKGTAKAPPGMKLVGEEGPELINDKGGYQIIPHRQSMELIERFRMPEVKIPKRIDRVEHSLNMNQLAKMFGSEVAKNGTGVSINIDERGFETKLISEMEQRTLINKRYRS